MAKPMRKAKATPVESRAPVIVSAVGIAVDSLEDPALAHRIEVAMAQAVTDCLASGVSIEDSPTIKAAMLAAKERVRREAGLPDD